MGEGEVVYLAWNDYVGMTRCRGVPATDVAKRMEYGLGWAVAGQALTPFDDIAPNPWGPMLEVRQTPVKETDKRHWAEEPAGYRFDGPDGARGAVEMLRPGRIWFTEKMPESEREPGACLLAGLMLYTEPSDHDE